MFLAALLDKVTTDTTGVETSVRAVGTREPPAKMALQIAIEGIATVRVQGRIAKTAPWIDMGTLHTQSILTHLDPVQYLRAITTGMSGKSSVSVWAAWGW